MSAWRGGVRVPRADRGAAGYGRARSPARSPIRWRRSCSARSACRVQGRDLRGAGVVHVLHPVVAGRDQPSRLRLCARQDDRGERVLSTSRRTPMCRCARWCCRVVVAAIIICLGLIFANAIAIIVASAIIGIYAAFQMIVLGALAARLARVDAGAASSRLGASAYAVNIVALAYGIGAIIDMAWPRTPDQPWYIELVDERDLARHHRHRRALHAHRQALRSRHRAGGRCVETQTLTVMARECGPTS